MERGFPSPVGRDLWRRKCPLLRNFCFVISKWHILVNSGVLNLKYVIILGDIPTDVTQPKYWGRICVPDIPGGVDASGWNGHAGVCQLDRR